MRFETFACERRLLLMAAPCRACAGSARGLRRFGGFATFYGCRSHPLRGGECAQTEQLPNSFTGSYTTPTNDLLVSIFLLHATRDRSGNPIYRNFLGRRSF